MNRPDPIRRPSLRSFPVHAAAAFASVAVALFPPPALWADDYLPPESPARRSMDADNGFTGGQPADLQFAIEDLAFLGDPCPDTTIPKILKKATFTVKVGWNKSRGPFGQMCLQAEGSDSTDGNDQLVVEINGRGRWTVESITRDGNDCLGGPSPEGVQGGAGTWDGVKLTPPESFEKGQYDDGSDVAAPTTMRYQFTLKYTPLPGDECKVVGFLVRGYYLHTYDGSFEWSCDNAIQVGVSFPWSVSLGGSVSATNDHAWSRPLVNALGADGNHTQECNPGPGWVPSELCCPQPVQTPDGHSNVDSSTTVPMLDPGSFRQDIWVSSTLVDSDDVTHVELWVTDPYAEDLLRIVSALPSPCPSSCFVQIPFSIPATYPYGSFIVQVTAWGRTGDVGFQRTVVNVTLPAPQVPTIAAASGLPDGRLLGNDLLLAFPHDPTVPPPVAAQRTSVRSVDVHGAVRDVEQGLGQFPDGHVQFQVQESPVAISGNHVLEVGTDDIVIVDYVVPVGNRHLSVFVPVDPNTAPNAILPAAASQPSFDAVTLLGTSWPMTSTIRVLLGEGATVQQAVVTLPRSSPAASAAQALKSGLAAAGAMIAGTDPATIAFASSDPHAMVSVRDRGQGLRWVGTSLPVVGDLNGDGHVDASDLGILLGGWGTAAADLTGDGTTDAADLGVLLGAWM